MAIKPAFVRLSADNPKADVVDAGTIGFGLIATAEISKGEVIADWTGGKIYCAKLATLLPQGPPLFVGSHAIQFFEDEYIDTEGIGRYLNHSCNPNCGIKGRFQVVAMRNIKKGEWLTFDYAMSEDSDWRMECKCGEKNCRKVIGAFANMPKKVRLKYKGYISDWLVEKYRLDE